MAGTRADTRADTLVVMAEAADGSLEVTEAVDSVEVVEMEAAVEEVEAEEAVRGEYCGDGERVER